MDDSLRQLHQGVCPSDQPAVNDWWSNLTDAARAELSVLLDPRADSCSFVMERDEHGLIQWQPVPVTVNSALLVEAAEPDADWSADYFEYQLTHPEVFPVVMYEFRPFTIRGPGSTVAA